VRRAVHATNTIDALHRQIRKIIKTRGSFPTEDSARKLLYLAITSAARRCDREVSRPVVSRRRGGSRRTWLRAPREL